MAALSRNSIFSFGFWSRLFWGLTLVGIAAGCGMGADDDSVQAKLRQDNEKLTALYSTVTGGYTGNLVTADTQTPLPATVQLYTETVQDGVDANNNPKSRLVLRGQLKLIQVGVLDDTNFTVDYSDIDGGVSFAQPAASAQSGLSGQSGLTSAAAAPATGGGSGGTVSTCQVGPRDARMAIHGTILGGVLNSTVTGTSGTIGTLQVTRQTTDSVQPIRDQADRLLKTYSPLVGTYAGKFRDDNPRGENFPVKISITLVDTVLDGFVRCPTLLGNYGRPDISEDFGRISATADFYPQTSTLVLKNTEAPGTGGSLPGHTNLTITATWNQNGFAGDMHWWNRDGKVTTVRCTTSSVDSNGNCGTNHPTPTPRPRR